MTPFDMLFFALVATLLLIIAVELWMLHRAPVEDDREAWIQVKPPDDQERDYTPVPDWCHKRKR